MSHPIDDLFRKGLKNASLQDHEEDWANARALLGFEDKRRRIPLWIWMLLGLILVATIVLFISLYPTDKLKPSIASDAYAHQIDRSGTTIVENELQDRVTQTEENIASVVLRDGAVPHDNKDELSTSSPDDQIAQIENRAVNSDSEINIEVSSDIQNEGSMVRINDKREGLISTSDSIDNPTDEHSNGRAEESITSSISGVYSDKENIKPHSKELQAIDAPSFLQISTIPTVALKAFPVSLEYSGEFPKVTVMDPANNLSQLGIGIYAGYSPDQGQLEGGIGLHVPIRAQWGLDIGLGLSRFSREEDAIYENVQVRDQFSSNSTLISTNHYRYYSIRVPVRFHYFVNRHSFFSGILLERPFALEGRQEVSLSQEVLDTAMPGNPILGSSSSFDPITSIQTYNLSSAPQLEKFIVYGQFGTGYQLSQNITLSTAALINWTKVDAISPLIDVSQASNIPTDTKSRWHILFRLDVQF